MFYDETIYNSVKSHDLVPCTCTTCGASFLREKRKITEKLKNNSFVVFCSRECLRQYQTKSTIKVNCNCCGKELEIQERLFIKSKTKRFYCSSSCSSKVSNATRIVTEETKHKISESLRKRNPSYAEPKLCKICGSEICEHPEICNLKIIHIRSKNLEKLGFDFSKVGTKDVYSEYRKVRDLLFLEYIVNKLTMTQIAEKYNLCDAKCVSTFLRFFNIPPRTKTEANRLFYDLKDSEFHPIGRKHYKQRARFSYTKEFEKCEGYELIEQYGWYDPIHNKNGIVGDHMLSRDYGFTHNIPLSVIRHPANCKFITQKENLEKGSNSSITLNELMDRIKNWDSL